MLTPEQTERRINKIEESSFETQERLSRAIAALNKATKLMGEMTALIQEMARRIDAMEENNE
jgi:hypothetical protein